MASAKERRQELQKEIEHISKVNFICPLVFMRNPSEIDSLPGQERRTVDERLTKLDEERGRRRDVNIRFCFCYIVFA